MEPSIWGWALTVLRGLLRLLSRRGSVCVMVLGLVAAVVAGLGAYRLWLSGVALTLFLVSLAGLGLPTVTHLALWFFRTGRRRLRRHQFLCGSCLAFSDPVPVCPCGRELQEWELLRSGEDWKCPHAPGQTGQAGQIGQIGAVPLGRCGGCRAAQPLHLRDRRIRLLGAVGRGSLDALRASVGVPLQEQVPGFFLDVRGEREKERACVVDLDYWSRRAGELALRQRNTFRSLREVWMDGSVSALEGARVLDLARRELLPGGRLQVSLSGESVDPVLERQALGRQILLTPRVSAEEMLGLSAAASPESLPDEGWEPTVAEGRAA